jgi:prolyl-tRNA synthetase
MRYSELFTKTTKEIPGEEQAINAQLLIKAGFINKVMAGVYEYLPLGLRTLNKIIQIIREEMNAIGGKELFMSSLQNSEVWNKTDRWSDEAIDIWFKSKLKNGSDVGLAVTHEEPLTELMTHHINSYKDLPRYVYQFQTKFRNEIRARSGLLRTREFIMKDLYSFVSGESEMEKFYEQAKEAYTKIFKRVGLGGMTYVTFASGGSFSKFSHEFQTVHSSGEDTIYLSEAKNIAVNKEVYTDEVLKDLGLDKDELKEVRATEVGNIFKLGTKFSEALNLFFTDKEGNKKPVIMGSYGIGPGRVMGTIVEAFSDKKGIVWPEAVAPFLVYLIDLTDKEGDNAYKELIDAGIEVFYDDRQDKTPGEKFSDADLMGIPYRIVISEKTGRKLELKKRDSDNIKLVTAQELIGQLK